MTWNSRLSVLLFVAFICAPRATSASGDSGAQVDALNTATETELTTIVAKTLSQVKFDPFYAGFMIADNKGIRLSDEGNAVGVISLDLYPIQKSDSGKKFTLVLIGYGGNGGAGLDAAKARSEAGDNVVVLRFPNSSGARGSFGPIKCPPNDSYERLEKSLIDWNEGRSNPIIFLSVLDEKNPSQVLIDANQEFQELKSLIDATKAAERVMKKDANAKVPDAAQRANSANAYEEAVDKFNAQQPKYYDAMGVPKGDLAEEMKNCLNEVLKKILKTYVPYLCLEAYSGQGFLTTFGNLLLDIIVDFLNDLMKKEEPVPVVSVDYPLGTTDTTFAYFPTTMIVISLRHCIFVIDGTKEYVLSGVRIVQINLNSIWKNRFEKGITQSVAYTLPQPDVVESTHIAEKCQSGPVEYSILHLMNTHTDKWDIFRNSVAIV